MGFQKRGFNIGFVGFVQMTFRYMAQLFTSLKVDLCQDIKEFIHLADALMEHLLEEIALLRHWYVNPNEKSNKYKSFLLAQVFFLL